MNELTVKQLLDYIDRKANSLTADSLALEEDKGWGEAAEILGQKAAELNSIALDIETLAAAAALELADIRERSYPTFVMPKRFDPSTVVAGDIIPQEVLENWDSDLYDQLLDTLALRNLHLTLDGVVVPLSRFPVWSKE